MLDFPDWVGRLRSLVERHGGHPMVFAVVRRWATVEYQLGRLPQAQEKELEDFLVDGITARMSVDSAAERTSTPCCPSEPFSPKRSWSRVLERA